MIHLESLLFSLRFTGTEEHFRRADKANILASFTCLFEGCRFFFFLNLFSPKFTYLKLTTENWPTV